MNILNENSNTDERIVKNIRAKIRNTSGSNRKDEINSEISNVNQSMPNLSVNNLMEMENSNNNFQMVNNENEISFNITPDEEEIKKDIKSEENSELENQNIKIQNEAKELIEKTRRMMETLDAHKFSDGNNFENVNIYNKKIANNSNFETINNPNSSDNKFHTSRGGVNEYAEEKPFDPAKILKIEKDDVSKSIKII